MTFFDTIRDTEIEVFAEEWDGDISCGIAYGPEVVYAKTLDGQPFELTELEEAAMTVKAMEIKDSDDEW
jgi:hypothetical protein